MEAAQQNSRTALICSIAELGEEASASLNPTVQPADFLHLLVEKKLYPDAVRFLAHALPRRESVWWAWVCARRAAGDKPPAKIKAALDATEKWIAQPNDENRRAVMKAAQAAGFHTPAGCAGLAAFLSGPSLAPPESQAVAPGPYDSAKAVGGAVTIAAVAVPEKSAESFRVFIQQGLEVAARIKLWAKGDS